jgi:hypothetical protein
MGEAMLSSAAQQLPWMDPLSATAVNCLPLLVLALPQRTPCMQLWAHLSLQTKAWRAAVRGARKAGFGWQRSSWWQFKPDEKRERQRELRPWTP